MKVVFQIFSIIIVTIGLFAPWANATSGSDKLKATIQQLGEEAVTAPGYNKGLVRHIVLFRYKDNVTGDQKIEIKKRFLALASECNRNGKRYVLSIETGAQNSGEGVDQELEQGFIVTFKSEGDRNYYVGRDLIQREGNFDPAHDAFKKFVGPFLHEPISPTGVLVFDFDTNSK